MFGVFSELSAALVLVLAHLLDIDVGEAFGQSEFSCSSIRR